MRVSVVIPTYNSADMVVDAVASVLAQTRPAAEVIVVDDGSTDDTAKQLEVFGGRLKYIVKPNGGVASARNRGVKEATGDAIAFLDADDGWHPKKLAVQTAVLEAHPELSMVGTKLFPWPCESAPEIETETPKLEEMPLEQLLTRNTLNTSSMLVRANTLRQAGEFDGALQGPEDFDLWIRVALCGKIAVLNASLTGYNRGRPGSLSKDASRMDRDTFRIIEKHKAMGTFKGRFPLHRKVLANNALRAAYRYFDAGMSSLALSRAIQSICYYPIPFARSEVPAYFARPRFAFAVVRRIVALKLGFVRNEAEPSAEASGASESQKHSARPCLVDS